MEQTIDAMADHAAPPLDLAPGVHFWRLRGRVGTHTGQMASPMWELIVGRRSAPIDTNWGTAADFNGDGYADLAVGAGPYRGSNLIGRVYVFLGNATGLPSSANTTLTGPDGRDPGYGWSVASAGDINGDGYADLVVGADDVGSVYVYFGSVSGLPTSASMTLTAPTGTASKFGTSIASAWDANGDGYADLAVGAYGVDTNTGRVYVYLGNSAGLRASASMTLTGPDGIDGRFGASVTNAGDVNGDGYADLAVGAYGVGTNTGRVYVYLGNSADLSPSSSLTLSGPAGTGGLFGATVASAGDVNGDGLADLAVGASGAANVHVFLGSITGLPTGASTTLSVPDGMSGSFGSSIVNAGDINGDGYADLAVGARGATTAGRAYVYLGSAMGTPASASIVLEGPSVPMGCCFGTAVATAERRPWPGAHERHPAWAALALILPGAW